MKLTNLLEAFGLFHAVTCFPQQPESKGTAPVKEIDCNGRSYAYNALAGYGFLPSDTRDKYGDTLGGTSSVAFDENSWKKSGDDSYKGSAWLLPDRGWYETLDETWM